MEPAPILDALIATSIGGGFLLGTVLWLARGATRVSGHVRHQMLAYALLTLCGVFLFTAVLRPWPIGCLTASCAPSESGGARELIQEHYTLAGAGKFVEEVPATASSLRPPGRTGSSRWLLMPWLLGAGLSLAGAARRRRAAAAVVRRARDVTDPSLRRALETAKRRLGLKRAVRLLRHPAVSAPAVAGTFRPALFVPSDFEATSPREVEMVLLHELAHVRRWDQVVTALGEIATSLFWFHPLVRLASRRLRDMQEIAADSHVLRSGVRPSRYAEYLLRAFGQLKNAQGARALGAHSILGDCLLDTRLRTILDPDATHRVPSRALSAALALCFVALGVGLALAPRSLEAVGLLPQARTQAGELDRSMLTPAAIDSVLRPLMIDKMADFYVAGAAVAVVHHGEIVYRAGFGDREVYQEDPVDPERTIFRIGSITKVITGIAVMQLVDRGLLDLEADVNDYLDAFEVSDDFDEPVRVRHLLTHTAGFDQIGTGRHETSREDVRPLGEFLTENLVRIRPPGEVSAYDTYAITLAGHLVELVSGLSYEEYLQREIFEPLGMHRSGITVPPALESDVAVGYEFRGQWFPQRWEYMNTDPASTVNATVTDMGRLAIMLLNGGELDGVRILSEAAVEAMLTQQYTNHPDHPGYGYAFFEDRSFDLPAFSHGGSMTGFAAFLYLAPEHDLAVYIAYNQESGSLMSAAMARLLGALVPGREPRDLRERSDAAPDLSRFVGTYANNVYNHGDPSTGWRRRPFDLETSEDGGLTFQGSAAYAVGPLSFQRDDGLLLSFRENERGEITHLFVNQAVYEKLP